MSENSVLSPQPSVLTIGEFEECEAALSAEAYGVLRRRYAKRIDVSVTERPGVYRIAARDYVGRIGLPGGAMLAIRPKVGVANLFYMLAASAGPVHFYPPPTGLTPSPEIFSFIMAMLLDRVEGLFRQGLYREFVPREEDLPL